MRVEFTVGGLPPKKDGANSMWGKDVEIPRLRDLRRAALDAMKRGRLAEPFQRNIVLDLELHVQAGDVAIVGDLDKFVTGVCDGLMAASGDRWRSFRYPEPEWTGIQPGRAVAIQDDAHVVVIRARKVPDDNGKPWYKVALEASA